MGLVDRVKGLLRGLLIRMGLLLAGSAALIIAIQINLDAGHQILTGLLSPGSPLDLVISVARLATPAVGLWLIYRGLR